MEKRFGCSSDVSLQDLGSGCVSEPQRGPTVGEKIMGPRRGEAICVLFRRLPPVLAAPAALLALLAAPAALLAAPAALLAAPASLLRCSWRLLRRSWRLLQRSWHSLRLLRRSWQTMVETMVETMVDTMVETMVEWLVSGCFGVSGGSCGAVPGDFLVAPAALLAALRRSCGSSDVSIYPEYSCGVLR